LPLFLNILWRETQGDDDLRRRALRGLRRYQEAIRPAPPPAAAQHAAAGGARLLRYGAQGQDYPVVFVPSIINPPAVLDLSESRSMLRHMAAAGHEAYLVDWGAPGASDAMLGLDGHVSERLVPLLATLGRPAILVGYCLGGTLAIGAAGTTPVRGVATLASPWRFSAMAEADRANIAAMWRSARPLCEAIGTVPMEILQAGFWAIDPARTVRKYANFADVAPDSDEERAFLAVEDWANSGPPLSFAAGRDLFELFYAADAPGQGEWTIGGAPVALPAASLPSLSIASSTDRIVPAATTPALGENRSLALGHVGMVVAGRAPEQLWKPLSEWLCSLGG
jgi:polyhydroxyalkanoate synthase